VRRDETWRRYAACQNRPQEWWFPEGDRGEALQHLQAGKRICLNECPVREECLDYALGRGEKFGTWGGLSEKELDHEHRNRPRRVGAKRAVKDAA